MKRFAAGLMIALLAPLLALADAPEPTKPVDTSFFSGRWYEIARTDNDRQRGCQAPTYVFEQNRSATRAQFTLTCRKDSPTGPEESIRASIRIPQDGMKNKFRVTALLGLASVDYWVLDIADDVSWVILATPDGENVWLLARRPGMAEAQRTRLLTRIAGWGYPRSEIILPRHG